MAAPVGVDVLSQRVENLNVVTKGGKVVQKVTERYLRGDLSCSSPLCSLCSAEPDTMTAVRVVKRPKTVLAESPRNGVYLLPSMRTVLLRVDVLEFSVKDKVDATEGQEVFADVWLKGIITKQGRRFVPFANEHHRACFVGKKVALPRGYENDDTTEVCRESDTDRNERAVATAWKWYANHLKELRPDDARVLFLSHDAEDLKRAEKYGVTGGRTIAEFLEPVIAKFPELQNLLSISTAEEKELKAEGVSRAAKRGSKQQLHPDYLEVRKIVAGIKTKRFYNGTIRWDHRLAGHVVIHGTPGVKISIVVEGWKHIINNRAIDGDKVAIQLLPKTQWKLTPDLCPDLHALHVPDA